MIIEEENSICSNYECGWGDTFGIGNGSGDGDVYGIGNGYGSGYGGENIWGDGSG